MRYHTSQSLLGVIAPRILREKRSRLTLGLEIAEPAVGVCVPDSGLRSVAARKLRRERRGEGDKSEGVTLDTN